MAVQVGDTPRAKLVSRGTGDQAVGHSQLLVQEITYIECSCIEREHGYGAGITVPLWAVKQAIRAASRPKQATTTQAVTSG